MENRIPDGIEQTPEQWIVAEQGVSPAVSMEYAEFTEKLDCSRYSEQDAEAISQTLFSPSSSIGDKKEALVILARLATVESYRAIKLFQDIAEGELAEWSILALHDCQIDIEESLLDRDVGVVMTGLGGAGERLRYFFLLCSKDNTVLPEAQKEAVPRTFSYTCDRHNSVLENIEPKHDYVMGEVLAPMDVAIGELIESGIEQCNKSGACLSPKYFVTNVGLPSEVEVLEYLKELNELE